MGNGGSTSHFEYTSPMDPGCSTKEQEPWWDRGCNKSGRKPPSFALYTREYLNNRTSMRRICQGLTDLSQTSSAHYLWCQTDTKGRPYVEIWAHPDVIEAVRTLVRCYVRQCTSERFPTIQQQRTNMLKKMTA